MSVILGTVLDRSENMIDFRSRRQAAWWPWPLTFWPINGVTGHPCVRA